MLDRQSRVNRHLKAGRSKVAKGAPGASEGANGDVTYRQIGTQLNQYVKKDNSWEQVSGTGGKAQIIQTIASGSGSGSTSSSGGITDHDLLNNLTDGDDHTQYVHNTIARTISAQHNYTNSGSPFTVTSDTLVGNLNADLLDGSEGSEYFKLADSETVTGIPAFNGGTSGSSSPFTVDSTQKVVNLNADQVDGKQPGTSAGDIAYYDSSTRVVDSQKLDGLDSASYFILSQNETVSGIPAFNGGTSGATAPFSVDSNYLVTNLNADRWDGYEFSDYIDQPIRTTDNVAFGNLDLGGAATITGDLTHDANTGDFIISSDNGNTLIEGTTFDGNHVTIPGNLTVSGTTVTLDTSTLQVEDQNIYLAYNNSGNAGTMDEAANAGGISLKAAEDKHFVWYKATDRWTASENIEAPGLYLKTSTETKITLEDTASALSLATIGTSNLGDIILKARYGCEDEVGGHTTQALCEAAHDNKWFTQGITINNENHLGGTSFFSGFAGSGWRITKDAYNEFSAEFDNLTVRGTMSVYELLIQQIRATNGSLIVASADKVIEAENLSGGASGLYKLTVEADDTDNFIHFKEGDLILAQKWTGGSGSDDGTVTYIKRVRATVTETSNSNGSSLDDDEFKAELESTDTIASTDLPLDFVRIGSTGDTDRQGGIYITSEDSGAPFIDIFNGVSAWADWRDSDKTKARLGRLDGITHQGTNLSSYGLFSDRVYLTGNITAETGYIGTKDDGWTIDSDQIYNGNFKLNANDERFQLGTITSFDNNDNTKQGIYMGKTSTGVYKIIIGKENAEYIEWNGSSLVVKGDITVSNPGDFADTTATNGMNATEAAQCAITNDGINLKNNSAVSLARFGAFNEDSTDKTVRAGVIGNSKSRLEIDNNGNLSIINRNSSGTDVSVISLSNAGNATFSGTVTANDGYIGGSANGWNINSGHMVNDKVKIDAANQLIKIGDVIDFTNDDPTNKGILIGKDGSTTDYEFFVGKEGDNDQLHWNGTNLAIKGDITVTNGGDFADTDATNGMNSAEENICVITNNGVEILNNNDDSLAEFSTSMRVGKIEDDSSRLEVDSSGNLSIINRQGSTDTTTISLSNAGNASFTGAVTATSGTFTGAVNASSGNITGNLYVKSGLFVGASDADGAVIISGDTNGNNGKLYTGNKATFSSSNDGIWMGSDGASSFDVAIGNGSKYMKWDGSAGTLDIRGSLNADDITAGTITGRTVQTASDGNRIVLDGSNSQIKLIDGNAEDLGSTNPERVIIDDDTTGFVAPTTYSSVSSQTNLNGSIQNQDSWDTFGSVATGYSNYKGQQGTVRLNFDINANNTTVRWTVQGSTDNFSSSVVNLLEIQEFTTDINSSYDVYGDFAIGNFTHFRARWSRRTGGSSGGMSGSGSAMTKDIYWRLWDQNLKINNGGLTFIAHGPFARIGMPDTPLGYFDATNTITCKGGMRLIQDGDAGYNDTTNTWRSGSPIQISSNDADSSRWNVFITSGNLWFQDKDEDGGYINHTVDANQMNFTGQHRAIGNSGMTAEQYGAMIGYIVRADGKYNNIEDQGTVATINDSMPVIELSDSSNDKRVFGVISSHEDTDGMREYDSGSWVTTMKKPEGDERVIINSLGEGAIWITNINGNLENGDYITSSTAAGLGQKQDDDLLHNYTVAKITQDCDFSSGEEFEHNGSTYKKQFVGCTYHCG